MTARPILILTAVSAEREAIAKALRLKLKHVAGSHGRYSQSTDLEIQLLLTSVGIGAHALKLVDRLQPQCVILAGFAGALDPSLKVGDIVLDDCPTSWKQGSDARFGGICCVQRLVATAADKAELFRLTGALAVDMESDTVRKWAVAAGVPFVSIRAISDSGDQDLNPAILRFIDDFGTVRPLALARELLRNPTLLRQLMRLRAATTCAGKNLGRAVRQLVERIREENPRP